MDILIFPFNQLTSIFTRMHWFHNATEIIWNSAVIFPLSLNFPGWNCFLLDQWLQAKQGAYQNCGSNSVFDFKNDFNKVFGSEQFHLTGKGNESKRERIYVLLTDWVVHKGKWKQTQEFNFAKTWWGYVSLHFIMKLVDSFRQKIFLCYTLYNDNERRLMYKAGDIPRYRRWILLTSRKKTFLGMIDGLSRTILI